MRALLFITYLFALLLTGGNETHANTHTVSNAPISQLKTTYKAHPEFLHSTREHSLPTIVNKDFDLNEEYSSSDICKDSAAFKTAKFKPTVLTKWYVSNDNSFVISFPYNRLYFTKPISGKSTPIYITQSVLRI